MAHAPHPSPHFHLLYPQKEAQEQGPRRPQHSCHVVSAPETSLRPGAAWLREASLLFRRDLHLEPGHSTDITHITTDRRRVSPECEEVPDLSVVFVCERMLFGRWGWGLELEKASFVEVHGCRVVGVLCLHVLFFWALRGFAVGMCFFLGRGCRGMKQSAFASKGSTSD